MPKLPPETEPQQRGSMDVLYNSDEFRMYCFKVLPCSKHYSHDWTICPFAHPGEKARRRDPRVFKYAGVECPHVKEGLKCPRGDLCPFAHNIFECWLHPTRYRTQLCNEPASCKRKVCFFAHALEELREPSNPIDSLPEGGFGSGRAPMMSLDGLGTAGTFTDLSSRGQLDLNSIQQLATLNASSPFNLNDLVSNIQGMNVQSQAQQNQQLTQLLINLLAEIDLNGRQMATQIQPNYGDAFPLGVGGYPRWSVDGHMLAHNIQNYPANLQTPAVSNLLSSLSAPQDMMLRRNASMESNIRDAMSQGNASHGRVSIDNSALTRPPVSHALGMQLHPSQYLTKRDSKKLSFKSIVEDPPARSSEEGSLGTSSGDTSTDSRIPESYPMSYPMENELRRSVDCSLPEPFILF